MTLQSMTSHDLSAYNFPASNTIQISKQKTRQRSIQNTYIQFFFHISLLKTRIYIYIEIVALSFFWSHAGPLWQRVRQTWQGDDWRLERQIWQVHPSGNLEHEWESAAVPRLGLATAGHSRPYRDNQGMTTGIKTHQSSKHTNDTISTSTNSISTSNSTNTNDTNDTSNSTNTNDSRTSTSKFNATTTYSTVPEPHQQ